MLFRLPMMEAGATRMMEPPETLRSTRKGHSITIQEEEETLGGAEEEEEGEALIVEGKERPVSTATRRVTSLRSVPTRGREEEAPKLASSVSRKATSLEIAPTRTRCPEEGAEGAKAWEAKDASSASKRGTLPESVQMWLMMGGSPTSGRGEMKAPSGEKGTGAVTLLTSSGR